MATNGDKVNATTTVSNGGGGEKNPKTIVDLNTTEPDIVDEGLLSDSVGEKKDEGESKLIGSDSGDVSPVDDIQKKIKRAERFGVTVKLTEEEKRNSRAERFGTVATAVNGSEGTKKGGETKKAEELKRKARADRFGAPASATTTVDKTEEEAKKKARLARFGIDTKAETKADTKVDTKVDSAEEDKRKARALRFSKAASDSTSDSPGKQSIGTEAVVSGNAS